MKTIVFITFPLLFIVTTLYPQVRIDGKVVDIEGHPVPSAYVLSTKSFTGTITNQVGEFYLMVSEEDSLKVSHISYQEQRIKIEDKTPLIKLSPRMIVLPELVVNDYANQCISKALLKTKKEAINKSMSQAFYRQITRNDTIAAEIIEAFFGLETSPNGIEKRVLEESRYALKKKDSLEQLRVNFSNFSDLLIANKVISETEPKDRQILTPFMPSGSEYYDFTVKEEFKGTRFNYVKIHFSPSKNNQKPSMEGDVIVNTSTYNMVHVDFSIRHSLGVDFLNAPSGKKLKAFDHLVTLSYDFMEQESSSVLNYIMASQYFKYQDERGLPHEVSVQANLVIFQHDHKKIRGLKSLEKQVGSLKEIKNKKYNPLFWKENSIVKKTPLEKSIIARFEKDGSFGPMFNSAKP
jgi:hypothetical protein